ncbi:MAG: 50S ribosomal protein L32 [Pseudomonadota bacterium]
MAVPKKRTSSSRRNMRRSHDHLTANASVEVCPACGELKLRHHVCPKCGLYRDRTVVEMEQED